MSLEIKGESCPICKAYLFEDDDIAVCPTCGAPHHRECFVNAKRCGMEELHGTDMQYDKVKKEKEEVKETPEEEKKQEDDILIECPSCHNRYSIKDSHCSNCGTQNIYSKAAFIGVDFLGGVNKDTDLGNGHTAEKVRNFVAVGTDRVIPKFLKFKNGKKTGFSLWSFLFPAAKFASRKMYKEAVLAGVIEIAAVLLMLPLSKIIGTGDFENYAELYMSIYEGNNIKPFLLATIGSFVSFALMLLCGLFADRFYYNHVLEKLSEIDSEVISDEEKFALYRKKGGMSLLAFLIALFAVQYLPSIIFAFIQ